MNILLNGEPMVHAEGELTLSSLLATHLFHGVRGVAVAVNHEVIPKSQWDVFQLKENDNILIIKATQGG
ncbi:sulfur carrier protein ThiS [Echinicola sp. CAU 1574]|uniref:Sulfur carrier protein ThiS n=1 Tax=Echinicola arenosa TaxID=2774144 RepID=A0ABR9AK99_9BACT|nr:sulfur carrier protein ThiS [Echinicola arenosa]MBD8489239.1 sulfur carrier protein ThiS [Echinicola arenosa]